jgi:YidC/Oxa1 family membrane protein insertase
MQGILYFLLFIVVFVLGGKYIFPIIGGVIAGLYHFIIAVTFNLLVAIYAIIPGHDFGVALIVFTIIIRLLMWPLLKKQLHQTKVMRKIQPELKVIKAKAKGDKQMEGKLMMELYKEKGVSPFGSVGVLIVQLPIILGLYQVVRLIGDKRSNIVTHSYSFMRHFGYMKQVTANINNFHEKLFGSIDLTQRAFTGSDKVYIPLMIVAVLAAIFQYYQSKQIMPQSKEKRSIRQLFKDANSGSLADQTDVTNAMNGTMMKVFPLLTFLFTISVQGGLALYVLTTGLVGVIQQGYILSKDEEELEEEVEGPEKATTKKTSTAKKSETIVKERLEKAQEAEIIAEKKTKQQPTKSTKTTNKKGTAKKTTKKTKRRG